MTCTTNREFCNMMVFGVFFLGLAATAVTPYYQNMDGQWAKWTPRDTEPTRHVLKTARGPQFLYSYADVDLHTGVGFDDPLLGELRRTVFESVLSYLGTVIQDNGMAEILVDASEIDGTGFVAMGSPTFPDLDGVFGGFAFDHITSGVDPCDIYECLGNPPDMIVQVDFGYPFFAGLESVSEGEFDLFTVLLRQVFRGLGWLSLADADGSSALSTNTFTRWDDLLFTGTRKKLWQNGTFNSTPDALLGEQVGVLYSGGRTMRKWGDFPPVFSPPTFVPGQSLSYWDPNLGIPALMSATILPGMQQRFAWCFERAAVFDLGYDIDVPRSGPKFGVETDIGGSVIFYTAIQADENWATKIGVVNTNNRSVVCHITAHAASGWPLGIHSVTLASDGHFLGDVATLFGDVSPSIQWIRIQSELQVFGFSYVESMDGTQAYAVNAIRRLSMETFIPHVAQNTDIWFTRSNVVNGTTSDVDIDLNIGSSALPLNNDPPFAADRIDILSRFGGTLPDASWGSVVDKGGRASIAGHELFGRVDGALQMAGVEFIESPKSDSDDPRVLYFAHIARDVAQFWTGFAFVNTSSESRQLTLRAWGTAGALVGEKTITLSGLEKRINVADEFLDGIVTPENVDWVEIEFDGDVIGLELFGTHDGSRLAGLEGTVTAKRELVLPFLELSGAYWHGVALANVTANSATIDLSLMDDAGNHLAQAQTQTLVGKEKKVFLVTTLFGTLPENAAWIRIQADRDLVGFELIGRHNAQTMAGILLQ